MKANRSRKLEIYDIIDIDGALHSYVYGFGPLLVMTSLHCNHSQRIQTSVDANMLTIYLFFLIYQQTHDVTIPVMLHSNSYCQPIKIYWTTVLGRE